MIKTSIIADGIKLSLVRSLFNEAKKYDDVIDFTLGDPDVQTHQAIRMPHVLQSNKVRLVTHRMRVCLSFARQSAGIMKKKRALSMILYQR